MKIPTYSSHEFPISPLEKLTVNERFPTDGLEELVINAQTLGSLIIYFDAEDEARVMAVGEGHLLPDRIERTGSRLFITANNVTQFFQKGQAEKIRIEVHVPVAITVRVQFGAGVLRLAGGEGKLTVDGGVGEIIGYSHSRDLHVNLSAGNLALHNLHGQAAIKLHMGAITLSWSELSGDEQVTAKCHLGRVDLHLPPAIGVKEEKGGLFLRKTVEVPYSTHITAEVSFGGLDIQPNKRVPVMA